MDIEQIRSELNAMKGRWADIARLAAVDYSIVRRFAHKDTKCPSVMNFLAIRSAVKRMK